MSSPSSIIDRVRQCSSALKFKSCPPSRCNFAIQANAFDQRLRTVWKAGHSETPLSISPLDIPCQPCNYPGKPPPMAARLAKALPFRRGVTASDVGVGTGIDSIAGYGKSLLGLEPLRSISIPIPIPTARDSNDCAALRRGFSPFHYPRGPLALHQTTRSAGGG